MNHSKTVIISCSMFLICYSQLLFGWQLKSIINSSTFAATFSFIREGTEKELFVIPPQTELDVNIPFPTNPDEASSETLESFDNHLRIHVDDHTLYVAEGIVLFRESRLLGTWQELPDHNVKILAYTRGCLSLRPDSDDVSANLEILQDSNWRTESRPSHRNFLVFCEPTK